MKRHIRILKWSVLTIGGFCLIGLLIDLGYTVVSFRELRAHPPLEREFRAARVGMTKEQVLQLFRPKLSQRNATYYSEVGSKIDGWSFSGPYSCYMIGFDPGTHLVSAKHRFHPASCIEEVEPRGLLVRWLWEKWDQIH